mmetsp:Transcript_15226/g.28907  ORF Transcript_15226/g.28907 Transcript_15226/m.28907 type:complete len:292 (-) Transcript_15226:928-1803(-)
MPSDFGSTTLIFTSSLRSSGKNATITGDMTPKGDFVTHIMAATQNTWTRVKIVVVLFGTEDHRVLGATEESWNRPTTRSHNSSPCKDVRPRYMKTPESTGRGTSDKSFRGQEKKTQAPIRAWILAPVTRFSMVPVIFPSSSKMDSDRTCAALRVVAPAIQGSPTIEQSPVRIEITKRSPCMPSKTLSLSRPFFIMYRGLLTSRAVIFWSRKRRTARNAAGRHAPHLAHTGRSVIGMSQGRPVVVTNFVGNTNDERLHPAKLRRIARATSEPSTTPIAGAKLDTLFRIDFVK